MKFTILIFTLALLGCAQLMNGESQPVIAKDPNQKIYFTTCSGAAEDWSSCNRKASQTCAYGFRELSKVDSPIGGRREITFQCKK